MDEVLTALEQQVGCYRRLAKLAEIQHEHVQQSCTDGLLEVLGQRRDLLDEMATLEGAIAPTRRRWAEYLAGLDALDRARAQELVSEAADLLRQITQADRNDTLVLQQRHATVGQQLNQAAAATQVNRTYAAVAYGRRPANLDIKS